MKNSRLRAQEGYSLILVLAVMVIVMALTVAAYAAVDGDTHLARNNQDQKQAYAAAEAGINDYFYHLNQNPDYWTQCVPTPNPTGVNQAGSLANTRAVPGSDASGANQERYAIELLPANGNTQCKTTDPNGTMLDASTGTIRIRSTGIVGTGTTAVSRSIVATFRRKGFLDFIYFTDHENLDPTVNGGSSTGNCATKYWRDGRGNYGCTEIQFAPDDVIAGPFHTEDEILVCGHPTFGRNAQDAIEIVGQGPKNWQGNYTDPNGYRSAGCSGGNSPNMVGTPDVPAASLPLPQDNTSLKDIASIKYVGRTKITLTGATYTVTNANVNGGAPLTGQPWPTNGVIYVSSTSCTRHYSASDPYPSDEPVGCADVTVDGTYSQPLTIGSQKDIIIDGDITHTGSDSVLGLIAHDFVRVYHPCTSYWNDNGIGSVQIDAAILALNDSFLVDNWDCGRPQGTLSVNGAIAQKFRGPVGTGNGGSTSTGYIKNYTYDDRLHYRSPPNFLNPIQTAWRLQSQTEQVPVATG